MLTAAVPDKIGNGKFLARQLGADDESHIFAARSRRNGKSLGVLHTKFVRHTFAQRLAVRHTMHRSGLKTVALVNERTGLVRCVAAEKIAHGEQRMGERTVGERGEVRRHAEEVGAALSDKQRAAGERHNAVPVGHGGEIFPCADGGSAVFGVGECDGKSVRGERAGALAVEADAVIRIIVFYGVPYALVLPDVMEHRLYTAGRGSVGVPGKIDRDRCGLSLRQRHGVAAVGQNFHIVGGKTVGIGVRLRAHLRGDVFAEVVAVEPFAGVVQPDGECEQLSQTLRGVRYALAVRLRGVLAEGVPVGGIKRQDVAEGERFHGKTVRIGGKRVPA